MEQTLWNFDRYGIKYIEYISDELEGLCYKDYPGWNTICFPIFSIFLLWPSIKFKFFSLYQACTFLIKLILHILYELLLI